MQAALERFEHAMEADRTDAEYPNNAGMALFRLTEYARARKLFLRATELNRSALYFVNLGMSEEQLGNFTEALAAYEKAAELEPTNYLGRFREGAIRFDRGEWKKAQVAWEMAMRESGESPLLLSNIALTHVEEKSFDLAEKYLRRAIKLDPSYAEAHYNLGLCFQRQEKLDPAREAYQHALDRKPDYYPAAFNLGLVSEKLGRKEEAARAYQKFLALDGPTPESREDARARLVALRRTTER